MKNRSRSEIIAQILECAIGGATKSKIMYKVFLSYSQVERYVIMLEENGLLTFDKTNMTFRKKSATFRTTPKGFQFVDMHKKLNEISGLAIVDSIRESIRTRSSKLP